MFYHVADDEEEVDEHGKKKMNTRVKKPVSYVSHILR